MARRTVFGEMGLLAASLIAATAASAPCHAASFAGLGQANFGFSNATAVSSDGSVVVGRSDLSDLSVPYGQGPAFRWTAPSGLVDLGFLPGGDTNGVGSIANAASTDGSVVVGASASSTHWQAYRWTEAEGMVALGTAPTDTSVANGTSANGSVTVGTLRHNDDIGEAFRWTQATGMILLGALPGHDASSASSVSGDGSVFVGTSGNSALFSSSTAFRWTEAGGMESLGLAGYSVANAISSDGSVIVGQNGGGFRWTEAEGAIALGSLPGGTTSSNPRALSGDGAIIVGDSQGHAFVWDAVGGMRDLKDVLVNDYALDLTGWTLFRATGISGDGRTIVGFGRSPTSPFLQGWIAVIPEPATALLLVAGLAGLAACRRATRRED